MQENNPLPDVKVKNSEQPVNVPSADTSMKIITVSFFLILLIVIGGTAYIQLSKGTQSLEKAQVSTTGSSTDPSASSTLSVIQNSSGVILSNERGTYTNLSNNEKILMDRYVLKFPLTEGQSVSTILLKYYDDNVALVARGTGKGSLSVSLLDIKTLQPLDENMRLIIWEGNYETPHYLIQVTDSGIRYYKAGDNQIRTVLNSSNYKQGGAASLTRTYVKIGGMQSVYDIAFDESTRILKVGIFEPRYMTDKEEPRLGSVEFTLE